MSWPPLPPLDDGYLDEFGVIHPEVYSAAQLVWRQAESFVLSTLGDPAEGQRYLFKASAAVSRAHSQHPDGIKDLPAYLRKSFKRLVLEELGNENGRRSTLERENATSGLSPFPDQEELELNQGILIQQIRGMMDEWTREVFELLVLGYDYQDIGQFLEKPPNAIRSRFSKQLKKIRGRFQR